MPFDDTEPWFCVFKSIRSVSFTVYCTYGEVQSLTCTSEVLQVAPDDSQQPTAPESSIYEYEQDIFHATTQKNSVKDLGNP